LIGEEEEREEEEEEEEDEDDMPAPRPAASAASCAEAAAAAAAAVSGEIRQEGFLRKKKEQHGRPAPPLPRTRFYPARSAGASGVGSGARRAGGVVLGLRATA
jgi:hypothetical protein